MTDLSATTVRWAEPGDAAAVADHIARVVSAPGHKRIAFTGGSTPIKVLALLKDRPLDWASVTIALTDDRCVPDDHPASNFGNIHAALGTSGAGFERLAEGAQVAPFDLVWLGMGEDGHVASLFPEMKAHVRPGPSVIATTPIPLPPEAPFNRLTLNEKALKRAREVILVITGTSKKALLDSALAGDDRYPVTQFLRGFGPPVTIYWSE